MTFSGADADALDRVAEEAQQAGHRLTQREQRINQALHAAPWHGRSADTFRHQWNSDHRRRLQQAAAFLDEAAEVMHRNATEQREASSGAGGSGGGGRETFSEDALGAVTPISLFDFGDSDEGRTLKLLLGLIGAIPTPVTKFWGAFIWAEDMRQFVADVMAGRSTAQQFEDRVIDTFGLIPGVDLVLAGREAFAISLPDHLEEPIMNILGLDPPIDEAITNLDHLVHGEFDQINPWDIIRVPGLPRIDAHIDLAKALFG